MAQHTTKYKLDSEGNNGTVTVGESVAINDLLYIDELMGKAYKAGNVDFASVGNVTYGTAQTGESTGRIVAETLQGTPQRFADAHSRNPAVLNDSQELFVVSPNGSIGVNLARYRTNGQVINFVVVDSTAITASNPQIVKLSNGNILVAFEMDGSIKYAVYDSILVEVMALATLVAVASDGFYMVALSGGGVALCYHDNADNTKNKLVILSNTGSVSVAAVDIWTRTGTSGAQFHRMAQLSNGNLAIVVSSVNTVSSIGLYYAIFTAAAVSVKAMALLDATSAAWPAEIDKLAGFFSIARANAANQKAYVFNNAGTLQGAEFSAATTAGNAANKTKIINNATNFYLLWQRSSDSRTALTLLPTTGTNYLTSIPSNSTTNNPYNLYLDAICDNNAIMFAYAPTGSSKNRFFVIDVSTRELFNSSSTEFGDGASSSNAGNFIKLLPTGTRSFICIYDYTTSTPGAYFWCAGKYGRTALAGVSKNSAVANGSVKLKVIGAFVMCNALKGSMSKVFDHTANAFPGNKGTLTRNAVSLKGF